MTLTEIVGTRFPIPCFWVIFFPFALPACVNVFENYSSPRCVQFGLLLRKLGFGLAALLLIITACAHTHTHVNCWTRNFVLLQILRMV